jgi:hypothetical protein
MGLIARITGEEIEKKKEKGAETTKYDTTAMTMYMCVSFCANENQQDRPEDR